MEDGLWKLTGIVFALFLIIIVPIMNTFEAEDRLVRMQVLDQTDLFLEKITSTGKIRPQDYENFLNSLNKLGYPFEVELKHYKLTFVPVYEDPNDEKSFGGEIREIEELFTDEEIKSVLFPSDGSGGKPYIMQKGDSVSIEVESNVKTKFQKLRTMLFLSGKNIAFTCKFIRLVKNEAY